MADKDIIERIRFLMRELNCRQAEFARKIDVDPSNLSKYLTGRLPISDSLLNRLVVNLGVDKSWLVDGSDLPFAKQTTPAVVSTTPSIDTRLPAIKAATPVYDIDVTAGASPRAAIFTDEQIVGWVNLPDLTGQDNRIIRVNGDSMVPVIGNGDYVVVREVTNKQYIFWGQIYVVLLDDFRMLKYVRRNADPQLVTLRSANPEYDDMEINRDDIRNMLLVRQILHLENRV